MMGRRYNCVNTSNFETHKSRYLQRKGSFFVLLVGFPIAKFRFSIKEWGKKVKLGQFTGKNNGFPFLDILGYLKNTHKSPKFGRVRQVLKTDILTFLENKRLFARTTYVRLLIHLKALYGQKMKEIDFSTLATQWSIFPDRRS